MNTQTPNGLRLLAAAQSWVGKNAHQDNLAPQDVACVDSFETVYQVLFGTNVDNIPGVVGTNQLYQILLKSKSFTEVSEVDALPGDVMIAPDELQGDIHAGHVEIMPGYGNNSFTGKWDTHLSQAGLKALYPVVKYFRCTDVVALPTA